MNIRIATMDDLDAIAAMEAQCFRNEEAATRESSEKRLAVFPNHFWLLEVIVRQFTLHVVCATTNSWTVFQAKEKRKNLRTDS